MKIQTCVPQKLPLRKLQWNKLAALSCKAHRILGNFDALLRQVDQPEKVFAALTDLEAIASVHSQKVSATLKEIVLCEALGIESVDQCDPRIDLLLNYKRALQKAALKMRKKTLTFPLMKEIHKTLKKGGSKKAEIGKFRKLQNWIGPEGCGIEKAYFYPPKAALLPASMKNLKDYFFYKEQDPLVQLAIFFAQLLIIHPFMDGNGRVARVLIPLFLYKKKMITSPIFYMSAYFKKHRLTYFKKLNQITAKEDWEGWIRFFLEGIIVCGKESCERAEKILQLYQEIEKDLSQFKNPKRLINRLFASPIIALNALGNDAKTKKMIKRLVEKKRIAINKKRSIVTLQSILTIDRKMSPD